MSLKIRNEYKGVTYFGVDLMGGKGVIKKLLGDLSQAEINNWAKLNPVTSKKFLKGDSEIKAEKRDNKKGEPLPDKPLEKK